MRRAIGFVMLIVTVGIARYMKQAQPVTTIASNSQTTVDATAVRNDLVAIANAERNDSDEN